MHASQIFYFRFRCHRNNFFLFSLCRRWNIRCVFFHPVSAFLFSFFLLVASFQALSSHFVVAVTSMSVRTLSGEMRNFSKRVMVLKQYKLNKYATITNIGTNQFDAHSKRERYFPFCVKQNYNDKDNNDDIDDDFGGKIIKNHDYVKSEGKWRPSEGNNEILAYYYDMFPSPFHTHILWSASIFGSFNARRTIFSGLFRFFRLFSRFWCCTFHFASTSNDTPGHTFPSSSAISTLLSLELDRCVSQAVCRAKACPNSCETFLRVHFFETCCDIFTKRQKLFPVVYLCFLLFFLQLICCLVSCWMRMYKKKPVTLGFRCCALLFEIKKNKFYDLDIVCARHIGFHSNSLHISMPSHFQRNRHKIQAFSAGAHSRLRCVFACTVSIEFYLWFGKRKKEPFLLILSISFLSFFLLSGNSNAFLPLLQRHHFGDDILFATHKFFFIVMLLLVVVSFFFALAVRPDNAARTSHPNGKSSYWEGAQLPNKENPNWFFGQKKNQQKWEKSEETESILTLEWGF